MNELNDYCKYSKEYSESGFMTKISSVFKIAGKKVVKYALTLYYAIQNNDVPLKYKLIAIGVLGYFILPIDIVPDTIPGLGYSDDLTALISIVKIIKPFISDDVKNKVVNKMNSIFLIK